MNVSTHIKIAITGLRFALGWFMFFAGIEKVLNPEWTAQGFLLSAKTFPEFYAWFAEPVNAWWVDPLNAWGITLILGVFVRPAAIGGALLMILYYFPHVNFPYLEHGFIVEEHIVYATAFVFLALIPTEAQFGLSSFLRKTFLGRVAHLRKWL